MAERSKSADARGPKQPPTEGPAPVTELPATPNSPPAASGAAEAQTQTHELVFTLDATTGEVVKVERLEAGSARTELTDEEYAALASAIAGAGAAALGLEASPSQLSSAQEHPSHAFALQALAPQPRPTGYEATGLTLEQLAYYQGMSDYAAAVAAASGMSAEELAYYQGMADYAAALG